MTNNIVKGHNMKRIRIIIMILVLTFGLCSVAYGLQPIGGGGEEFLTPLQLRQLYMADENVLDYYGNDLAALNTYINARIADYYRFFDNQNLNNPMYLDTNVAGVYTTLVQQTAGNYCGPTSAYMAIQGWNGVNSIPGNNLNAKIASLATSMGIANSNSGATAGAVTATLNDYISTYEYNWYSGGTLTQSMFNVYVFNSLAYLRAPVLLVRTNFLPYYGGHSTGHYVTVAEFDYDLDDEVCIYDPHNNNAYYGVHQVAKEDAYKAIHDAENTYGTRALICYW